VNSETWKEIHGPPTFSCSQAGTRPQASRSSNVGIIISSIGCQSGRELNISYACSPTWQWQESRRLISRRSW